MSQLLPYQTFIDAVGSHYKTLEGLFDAAVASGVGITDELANGTELSMPAITYTPVNRSAPLKSSVPVVEYASVLPNQCLLDLAVQESGTLEQLFAYAANNSLGITEEPTAGSNIKKGEVVDARIVKLFSIAGKKPASITTDAITLRPGGIGYMQIGNDFIVS